MLSILFILAGLATLALPSSRGHVLFPPKPLSHNQNNFYHHMGSPSDVKPSSPSTPTSTHSHQYHPYPSSVNFTVACRQDADCQGKNDTITNGSRHASLLQSELFYDANARCDLARGVCSCRSGYKPMALKVKARNRRTIVGVAFERLLNGSSSASGGASAIFMSKCVVEREESAATSGHPQDDPIADELNVILRSLYYYGANCDEDRQCTANLICRQLLVPSASFQMPTSQNLSSSSGSPPQQQTYKKSLAHLLMANRTKRCRCPLGQHWNKHSRRCEFSSSNGYSLLSGPSWLPNANGSSDEVEPEVHGNQNGGVHIAATNIDLKIFEIVLEIAFLVACLIGYKACSRVCCRDSEASEVGSTDDCHPYASRRSSPGDDSSQAGKSDEESVISSTAPVLIKSSTTRIIKSGTAKVNNFSSAAGLHKKKSSRNSKRRVSRFYARTSASAQHRRSTSPYSYSTTSGSVSGGNGGQSFRRLSSVSATSSSGGGNASGGSTRNLLVKLTNLKEASESSVSTTLAPNYHHRSRDSSPSQCYNCRIYKEVYSPNARCKSCRTSMAVNGAQQALGVSKHSLMSEMESLLMMSNGGAEDSLMVTLGSASDGGASGSELSPSDCKKSPLLPLPPYKQKPIRRSEEVGVPPHLRAPYRDIQPFWLKPI